LIRCTIPSLRPRPCTQVQQLFALPQSTHETSYCLPCLPVSLVSISLRALSNADVATHLCSIHRRKCRPTKPDAPCSRCISLNTTCTLARRFIPSRSVRKKARNIESNGNSPTSPILDENLWPPQPVREELVNLYFTYIHDKHHSLFHQPTFMELLGQGKVPDVLLCAMMALAAR
jgi:arginyl-tRNA--protein-N-Asp/Glu arginylyltransferase